MRLADYARSNATEIYGDLDVQLSYPFRDPAHSDYRGDRISQQRMCTVRTAVLALGFVVVALWRCGVVEGC